MVKKTYLVTGGAGFIGSHLCEALLKKGNKVVCFDDLSSGNINNIAEFEKNDNFTFIQGDANSKEALEPVFKKYVFDGVFHYATVVGVKRTIENPTLVLRDIDGIRNVLDLALQYGKPKVVFASSSEVYGEPKELPEKEDGAINPKIPYAAVKLMGEKFLEAYWQKYQLKTCSLRFFNVYGPKQESSDYGFVVGIFIKQVLSGTSPTIFGDGSQTRDFVFVQDNITASLKAMESNKSVGQIINIGTGRPLAIFDLANTIINLAGQKGKLKPKFVKTTRIDVKHRFPEVGKMITLLGFHPQVSLEEGLRKTMEYYRNING
jgi:UDP-glucose 4-epimerase